MAIRAPDGAEKIKIHKQTKQIKEKPLHVADNRRSALSGQSGHFDCLSDCGEPEKVGLQLLRSGSLKIFGFDREFIRTDPLEVVVEEPIEDGVRADGGDADEVEDHEEGHHVLGVVE